jgi:hypothetical protein
MNVDYFHLIRVDGVVFIVDKIWEVVGCAYSIFLISILLTMHRVLKDKSIMNDDDGGWRQSGKACAKAVDGLLILHKMFEFWVSGYTWIPETQTSCAISTNRQPLSHAFPLCLQPPSSTLRKFHFFCCR